VSTPRLLPRSAFTLVELLVVISRIHDQVNVAFWGGHCETQSRDEVAAVKDPNVITAEGPVENRRGAWEKRWELTK
jgi:prepilin-type processing-associated H-X9-DG protein